MAEEAGGNIADRSRSIQSVIAMYICAMARTHLTESKSFNHAFSRLSKHRHLGEKSREKECDGSAKWRPRARSDAAKEARRNRRRQNECEWRS